MLKKYKITWNDNREEVIEGSSKINALNRAEYLSLQHKIAGMTEITNERSDIDV